MKCRISATVDEESVELLREQLRKDSFRNKSHVIEYALKKTFLGSKRFNKVAQDEV